LSQNSWTTESEIFPGSNTNCAPFAIPWLGSENVFLQARDWTGLSHGGNSTPDWWLWYYFGTTNLTDNTLDTIGNSLGYDYTNAIDPNVISFSVSTTNNHVGGYAPIQLGVTAGTPSYVAISIDDSNFAADASWQPYTSTNLSAGPMGEGWHTVWIGLRGRAPTATPTWKALRIKVDTSSPTLVITSPAGNTVDTPIIQIKGCSTKALLTLTYDLSSDLGSISNQYVAITNQVFDTNSWEITTNYFQAYDVELAPPGHTNTITLHATDLAGHTTSTTLSI